MLLNFKEICRLCLQSGNKLHPIFDTTDKLQEKIQTISPTINLCAADNLPTQMCQQCIKKVNTCYNFKLQCERSDATLRQCLNGQGAQGHLLQVMLKEEPLLCEDNTDTVTFNKHIFPLGNSNCKEQDDVVAVRALLLSNGFGFMNCVAVCADDFETLVPCAMYSVGHLRNMFKPSTNFSSWRTQL